MRSLGLVDPNVPDRKKPAINNSHLPRKTCAVCGREFAWRKKWERDWESVRYCSDRCRRARSTAN